MSRASQPQVVPLSREQQVEALLEQLRPKLEATARRLVERALDVPEAEEFGPIDLEFRDAGLDMATEVRRAAAGCRKKRGM
jgi:hypothetical protein